MKASAEYTASSRKPTDAELALIHHLIDVASINVDPDWEKKLVVCPMNDGGMGSLRLFPKGNLNEPRAFGKQVSEYNFADKDGVDVICSLNVDQNGELLELDIWKTNFSALSTYPMNTP